MVNDFLRDGQYPLPGMDVQVTWKCKGYNRSGNKHLSLPSVNNRRINETDAPGILGVFVPANCFVANSKGAAVSVSRSRTPTELGFPIVPSTPTISCASDELSG